MTVFRQTDARRHADPESGGRDADIVSSEGREIRALLRAISRAARSRDEDIRTYQLHLIDDRQVAPTSVAGTVAALRFLYQVTLKRDWAVDALPLPKRGETLPVVLSPEEVVRFLDGVARPEDRMILTTCYAARLRLSEALRLQVTDVDSNRMVLHVAQGKGARDRYVMLSPTLFQQLRAWWRVERPARWLFPGRNPEQPMQKGTVQWACRLVRYRSRLGKPVTPHSLRNAST